MEKESFQQPKGLVAYQEWAASPFLQIKEVAFQETEEVLNDGARRLLFRRILWRMPDPCSG